MDDEDNDGVEIKERKEGKEKDSRNNRPELIHPRHMWNRLSWVLGVPG